MIVIDNTVNVLNFETGLLELELQESRNTEMEE
jgi:hypothetical protein